MPVVVTVVVKIPPNETNASVFAGICKPCSNIFNSCNSDVSEVVQKAANRFAGITIVERYSSL